MEIVTSKCAKLMDEYTINNIGIPGIVLMENAASEIYSSILHKGEKFIIFCGTGNNGGDGLAVARKLILSGKKVVVVICGNLNKGTEEFNLNLTILKNINAEIIIFNNNKGIVNQMLAEADVIVDAIFGIGLSRDIEGIFKEVIELINSSKKYTVSIDIPSGLNGNTGIIMGICIKADETITVETYKKGFFLQEANEYTGKVTVINIGYPESVKSLLSEKVRKLSAEDYKNMIPTRKLTGHKGDYGRVLILAGSKGYSGAAYMTAEAAVKTGAGLVTLVTEKEVQDALSIKLTEAMTKSYDDEEIEKLINNATVIACGPGLSKKDKNKKMLEKFICNSSCPLILDADALNIISENKELLKKVEGRAIITPHPGEMARLINKDISYVNSNRIDECVRYSRENKIITLLKGYNTVISDGKDAVINTTGSSKMASGGMGDTLTGIITALVAQKINLFDSAVLGAYLHGLIGDILSKDRYIVNAGDIINSIPETMEYILKK